MNELEKLIRFITSRTDLTPGDLAPYIGSALNEHSHDMAEKIREKQKSDAPLFPEEDLFMNGYGSGLDDAADLIDPYVKGE